MTDRTGSLDALYFERVYEYSEDPWHFETSDYEAQKYAATLAALPQERFERALEIGCSIGVLTERLAAHCESLLSLDINERALDKARARCRALENVRFERMVVPREFPPGPFDLVVLSEVAYYWSDDDLRLAIDSIVAAAPNGFLVLVHYLPKVDDYVRDGDAVHRAFLADDRFVSTFAARAEQYRIDVLRVV